MYRPRSLRPTRLVSHYFAGRGACGIPLAGALTDTFSLVIGESDLRSFNQLQPPNLRLSSAERFAAALVLVSQILLISFLVINFFFAILGYT